MDTIAADLALQAILGKFLKFETFHKLLLLFRNDYFIANNFIGMTVINF